MNELWVWPSASPAVPGPEAEVVDERRQKSSAIVNQQLYLIEVLARSSRPLPVMSQPVPVAARIPHNSAWLASRMS